MAEDLPPLSKLSPSVYRILGCNPGPFTLQGTNSYLIGSGSRRLLLDTTEPKHAEEYADALEKALLACGSPKIVGVICTHWHVDHVGAVAEVMKRFCDADTPVYKFLDSEKDDRYRGEGVVYKEIEDGTKLEVEGATLTVLHTPGHTQDHISLLFEEENAIFAGDTLLGEGTTVFEDLLTYLQSLKRLLALQPKLIYPAHGPVVNNPAQRIEFYINHRNKRERDIVTLLRDSTKPLSELDLVAKIYEYLPDSKHLAAAHNVKQTLVKLQKENVVKQTEAHKWVIL